MVKMNFEVKLEFFNLLLLELTAPTKTSPTLLSLNNKYMKIGKMMWRKTVW